MQPEAADRTFIFHAICEFGFLYHPDSVRGIHAANGTAARPLAAKKIALIATATAVGMVQVQVTVAADASFNELQVPPIGYVDQVHRLSQRSIVRHGVRLVLKRCAVLWGFSLFDRQRPLGF